MSRFSVDRLTFNTFEAQLAQRAQEARGVVAVKDSHPVASKAPGSLESDQGLDLWSYHQAAKAGAHDFVRCKALLQRIYSHYRGVIVLF